MQACFTSGLLLTGTLYVVHADDIPRSIVLITVGLVAVSLSLRRLVYRCCFITGTTAAWARAMCLLSAPARRRTRFAIIWRASAISATHSRDSSIFPDPAPRFTAASGEIVGSLETLFQRARTLFVDEIFFTSPCERGTGAERA